MADILLKDGQGNTHEYHGVESIKVPTVGGGFQLYGSGMSGGDIYVCKFGETTFADAMEAYSDGKQLIAYIEEDDMHMGQDEDRIFLLSGATSLVLRFEALLYNVHASQSVKGSGIPIHALLLKESGWEQTGDADIRVIPEVGKLHSGTIATNPTSPLVVSSQDVYDFVTTNAPGIGFLTTAPTEDNLTGLKIVVLDSEPATKYEGYLYIIKES